MSQFFRIKFLNKKKNHSDNESLFAGGNLRLKDVQLGQRNKSDWLEDTYVDFSEDDLSSTKKNYLGTSLNSRRVAIFLSFVFICIVLLLSRAVFLQIIKGPYYQAVSEQNRIRIYNLTAPRGIIYDTNGVSLVKNIPNFAVYISPYDLNVDEEKKEKTFAWLRKNLEEFEIEEDLGKILEITARRKEYFEPVLLVDGLEYDKAIELKIESADFPGITVEVRAKREYLNVFNNSSVYSLSHILGYDGKINPEEYDELKEQGYLINDYVGKTGIEATMEKPLRGVYGREQVEVDSTGRAIKILATEDVQKGDNIYLNIDVQMQQKLEEFIRLRADKIGQKKASAVVMDPRDGSVLAMVSLPGYDNNLFAQGISQDDYSRLINDENKPLFNRVVSGEYPSGSTIKPVIGASALEEGIVTEHTSFLSTGGIRIGQWFFPDWRAGGHGITNIRKALADSVNTYFYIVGGGRGDQPGLGVYKIKEYLEKFGLYALTGIDLPNERPGFLPTPEWKEEVKGEPWYIGDTYHLAIGQGDLLVTPLQVANYTNVFANKGTLYKPQLVDRYLDQSTHEIVKTEPEIINENFVKENNLKIVREGMRQAVTSGSARILKSLPVSSAGKTGTAQWKLDEENHSWFISFAPYENAEISMTVLVEEGGDGSQTAAYITNDFLNWYFRNYK